MRYALTQVTAPATEPLELDDTKNHLGVDLTDDDGMIERLTGAARRQAESYLGRALITQTWEMHLDRFPVWTIKVPRPPLRSIESLVYIDSVGTTQTLEAERYRVDTASEPGRITPTYGGTWPATRAATNALTVQFKAGYGDAEENVPEDIRQALLLLVGSFYEHREDIVVGETVALLPRTAKALLHPYRMVRV